MDFSRGGRLEYLQRSFAGRRRRRKEKPVSGVIIGPPYHGGTQIWRPGPPGCVLIRKILLLQNPRKWKSDTIWQKILRNAMAQKGLFANDDDDLDGVGIVILKWIVNIWTEFIWWKTGFSGLIL